MRTSPARAPLSATTGQPHGSARRHGSAHGNHQTRRNALRHQRRRRRAALLLLAGLAVLVTACGGGDAGAAVPELPIPSPDLPTSAEDDGDAADAPVDTDDAEVDAPEVDTDHRAELGPVVVARADGPLEVYAAPGDTEPHRTLPATTDFGSTTVVLVAQVGEDDAEGWLEVLLPGRPNGATGWIRTGDVELQDVAVAVLVDLADRELTVYADGEPVLTSGVAIGDAEHPTPTGRFFVTDKVRSQDPDGPYGPYALGLSGRSEVLTEFAGGDGQIGIHGTNDPDSIGQAASHGCVRVPNAVVRELVSLLPLGTPVVIS